MKKKFRHGIKGHPVFGNVTWSRMLVICARDVGLKPLSAKVEVIAKMLCDKFGWEYQDKRGIIARRSLELLEAGVPARIVQKKKFIFENKAIPSEARKLATKIPGAGAPHPDYVRDDSFYKSREWRQLRYLALRNCQGCQCCGAKASDGIQLHVDHVLPRYKYPHLSLSLENLQVLCDDCNLGKGAWDQTDWRSI